MNVDIDKARRNQLVVSIGPQISVSMESPAPD